MVNLSGELPTYENREELKIAYNNDAVDMKDGIITVRDYAIIRQIRLCFEYSRSKLRIILNGNYLLSTLSAGLILTYVASEFNANGTRIEHLTSLNE